MKNQMNHIKQAPPQANRRARLRVGPATLLAAGVGAFLLYGQMTHTQPAQNDAIAAQHDSPHGSGTEASGAGRIVYEADALGHLQHVAAPSQPSLRLPPLFKPEVAVLLGYDVQLSLQPGQRTKLKLSNSEWLRQKDVMEQQIERSEQDARTLLKHSAPSHNTSTAMVASTLSDYSALSDQYDRRREIYWRKALSLLTAPQAQHFDSIRKSATGDRGSTPIPVDTKGVSRR